MTTYNNLVEGRPPDPTRPYPKHVHSKNSRSHPPSLVYSTDGDYNNYNYNNNLISTDVNKNHLEGEHLKRNCLKQTIPNLLCIKRPATLPDEGKYRKISAPQGDKESASISDACDNFKAAEAAASSTSCPNSNNNKDRNRNSFHQDVEEALNSLLWQPYEYQKRQKVASSSCSSCSSSSLTLPDLDDSSNKGPLHSSQENTDLNLCLEMVNNLKPRHQCRHSGGSRDVISCEAASRLNSQVSLGESGERCGGACWPSAGDCDVFLCKSSDMQLEIPPNCASSEPGNVLSIHTDLRDDGLAGKNQGSVYQKTATTPNDINQISPSLSSANVVGLPNHPRRASVPSTAQIRNSAVGNSLVFPIHPRNASEPSTVSVSPYRYSANQSNVSVSPPSQERNNQTDQNLIAHLRSSSVPKSMYIQSGTTATVTPNHQRMLSESGKLTNQKLNVSNVNVNFYRAVPVNVVSSVPTIQCLNTVNTDEGNNVSNVHIMPLCNNNLPHLSNTQINLNNNPQNLPPAVGTTQVTIHNIPAPNHLTNVAVQNRTRTFTSTEAQTDEIAVCPPPISHHQTSSNSAITRQQRRKERRDRRHQRRLNNNHRHTVDHGTQANTLQNERLPDLLNNHLPPPYTPLSNNPLPPPPNVVLPNSVLVPHPQMVPAPPPHTAILQSVVPNGLVTFPAPPPPPPQQVVPGGQVPLVQGSGPVPMAVPPPSGFRFPFPAAGFRRGRFSEEPPKGCCGLLAWKPGSLRWFIAVIALIAVCCVLVGTILGAMRPAGRDHLTVSLLMIGVGIVLVTVSGVAWRLTSHDSSSCRTMLGFGSTESVDVCTRRFVPRLPPSYGRPHHPYAAMMYPEFQYRPPPPSYQASMQEYRLRLLLLDRGNTPQIQAGIQNTVSPPPTYRSHAGSLLRAPLSNRRDTTQSEYSCPPSYRSQTSTNRPGAIRNNSVLHSREQSLSLSESNNGEPVVNVVNILGSTDEDIVLDNITLDSLKIEPESDINNPLRMLLKASPSDLENSKDGNLVTIVQTNDQNPVIVTVSGSSQIEGSTVQITEITSEMEILAHL